ncbi:MAG TPA: hypothetical protein VE959_37345 [Bryobacteraceae bacterium]|nr:hypothetical protein [Bryobacteraceae bacterium]
MFNHVDRYTDQTSNQINSQVGRRGGTRTAALGQLGWRAVAEHIDCRDGCEAVGRGFSPACPSRGRFLAPRGVCLSKRGEPAGDHAEEDVGVEIPR